MGWLNIAKSLIGKVPILGAILNSDKAPIAAAMIGAALGVEGNPEAIEKALAENPDAIKTLIEWEGKNEQYLMKVQFEDVRDAREMEESMADKTEARAWFQYGLASLIVAGFFIFTAVIMFKAVQDNVVISMAAGVLFSKFGDIVSYFFGSSKSSSDKNKFFGNMINKNTNK